MSFGLQVFNAAGELRVDISKPLSRFIASFAASASASGSQNFSSVANEIFAFSVPVNAFITQVPHTVTITGKTVSWSPDTSVGSAFRSNSQILVFTYE